MNTATKRSSDEFPPALKTKGSAQPQVLRNYATGLCPFIEEGTDARVVCGHAIGGSRSHVSRA